MQAITKTLGFKPSHFVDIRSPCDRPHIKFTNVFMEHPYSSQERVLQRRKHDLLLTYPALLSSARRSILVVALSVSWMLSPLSCFLVAQISEVVMPYNSLMSKVYRKLFVRVGDIEAVRVVCCSFDEG
ncbi:hypothetical protein BC629DRAFT_909059 [Irpex lacteus]|nr:hypothetical protein BC629DRAFT_909059 [Irpex lacteus]